MRKEIRTVASNLVFSHNQMKEIKAKIIIVMGVSGSGKTTLGKALSEQLHFSFIEGDDYHPTSNVQKMSRGIPLNDEDRKPWLQALNTVLKQQSLGAVLACSALKENYRQQLSHSLFPKPQYVFIDCEKTALEKRMQARKHFMPASLLQSQLDTLEKPLEALVINGNLAVDKQLTYIMNDLI